MLAKIPDFSFELIFLVAKASFSFKASFGAKEETSLVFKSTSEISRFFFIVCDSSSYH